MRYARIEYIKEGDYDIRAGHLYEVVCIDESGCYIVDDEAVMQVVDHNQITIVDKEDSVDNVIKVKYFDNTLPRLNVTSVGDCIDLRVSKVFKFNVDTHEKTLLGDVGFDTVNYKAGDVLFMKLGVGFKLPAGYKLNVYPRSSSFKNFGFILTNSIGIIDNSYCGDEDELCAMVYCITNGEMHHGDRILQCEPVPVYTHTFVYQTVDTLDEKSRGGYGSTGVN